jgi:hypothetical protein
LILSLIEDTIKTFIIKRLDKDIQNKKSNHCIAITII